MCGIEDLRINGSDTITEGESAARESRSGKGAVRQEESATEKEERKE